MCECGCVYVYDKGRGRWERMKAQRKCGVNKDKIDDSVHTII